MREESDEMRKRKSDRMTAMSFLLSWKTLPYLLEDLIFADIMMRLA